MASGLHPGFSRQKRQPWESSEPGADYCDAKALDLNAERNLGISTLHAVIFPTVSSTRQTLRMSSNVGLTTPRGSGTSGYVQRNLSHLKPRDNFAPYPKDYNTLKHQQRKPDQGILDYDRLREIEVKVFDLRDKLEDEGYVCPPLEGTLPIMYHLTINHIVSIQ